VSDTADLSQAFAARTPAAAFALEVITLVPELWPQLLAPHTGLVGKAFTTGRASLTVRDLRDFGKGVHKQVDDSPFGGGAGMVLAVEPLHKAILAAKARTPGPVVLLSPRGRRFDQAAARRLAQGPGMTLICGRYEGMDERVHHYIDESLSLGDFVLSAGDPAAFAIVDATIRLRAGVLGNPLSLLEESFSQGLLEYPQYTRPAVYDARHVPSVLRGGDHQAVARWRREQAEALTAQNPPAVRLEGSF
jgi:tRNA (guanine37-N1)-methyltransferase